MSALCGILKLTSQIDLSQVKQFGVPKSQDFRRAFVLGAKNPMTFATRLRFPRNPFQRAIPRPSFVPGWEQWAPAGERGCSASLLEVVNRDGSQLLGGPALGVHLSLPSRIAYYLLLPSAHFVCTAFRHPFLIILNHRSLTRELRLWPVPCFNLRQQEL